MRRGAHLDHHAFLDAKAFVLGLRHSLTRRALPGLLVLDLALLLYGLFLACSTLAAQFQAQDPARDEGGRRAGPLTSQVEGVLVSLSVFVVFFGHAAAGAGAPWSCVSNLQIAADRTSGPAQPQSPVPMAYDSLPSGCYRQARRTRAACAVTDIVSGLEMVIVAGKWGPLLSLIQLTISFLP